MGAAYITEGGCSDDNFTDFRYWLISMGRDVYESALTDPQSLGESTRLPGVEVSFFQEFGYVAREIMDEKGISDDTWETRHPREPQGIAWKESDLPTLFPKLWAKFS